MDAELFTQLFVTVLTAYIVLSCICRVNLLDPKAHKRSWSMFYILFVYYAGGVLIESMTRMPEFYELAGLVGIASNLWMTKATWGLFPPPVTHKAPSDPVKLDVVTNRDREIIRNNIEAGYDLCNDLRDDSPQLSRQRSMP